MNLSPFVMLLTVSATDDRWV